MTTDWRWQLRMDIRRGALTPAQVNRLWDVIRDVVTNERAEQILSGGIGKQKSLEGFN